MLHYSKHVIRDNPLCHNTLVSQDKWSLNRELQKRKVTKYVNLWFDAAYGLSYLCGTFSFIDTAFKVIAEHA